MRVDRHVRCTWFMCDDVDVDGYSVPAIDVRPERTFLVMISEATPDRASDGFYAKGRPLYLLNTVQAFRDAGAPVRSLADILELGVYMTTAVKCAKTAYTIQANTVRTCALLLERELDEPDRLVSELDFALHSQDGGSLEPGGDAPIQVLLADDVDLADDVELAQKGDLEGDLKGFTVERKRRGVVDVIGAGRLILDLIDDLLAGFKLHERSAVILPQLAERGPHVTDDLGIEYALAVVKSRRTIAEKFFAGFELLVNLESGLESHAVVVFLRREGALHISHGPARVTPVLQRIKCCLGFHDRISIKTVF